jgi:hypothetical protein
MSIKINSKMEKMCKRLLTFVQQKDILGLQRTVSGRVSCRTPSSTVVNESVMVGRNDDKDRLIDVTDSFTTVLEGVLYAPATKAAAILVK